MCFLWVCFFLVECLDVCGAHSSQDTLKMGEMFGPQKNTSPKRMGFFLYPPPLRRLLRGSYDTYKEIRFNKGPVLKKPTEPTENMWYILCAYIHPVMAHRVLAHTKGGIDFFVVSANFVKLHQLSKDKVRTGPTPSPPHVSHLWLLHDVIHQTDLSQIRGLRHGSR